MEKNLSTNDLEIYPLEDLLNEVMKRCAPAIFIGTRYEGETGERSWKNFNRYSGNIDTCRGLCKELDSNMERQIIRDEYERQFGEENTA